MEPFSFKLHYVLPHYHALGSSFFVALAGGTRDGEVLHEIGAFDGEAHGKTFFPPVDIDQLGDRKKLAEFCYRQVSLGVQAANAGRDELLPRLA